MKALANSKFKLLAGLFCVQALLAVAAHFVVIPMAAPGLADAAVLRITLAMLILGVVGSGIVVLLALSVSSSPGQSMQELFDHLRQPAIVVDEQNRYALANRAAERLLGLDRERDRRKPVDQRILAGMAVDEQPDSITPGAIFTVDDRRYQVINNPLPEGVRNNAGWRTVVFLRDVTSHLRVREAVREVNETMAVLNANTSKIASSAVALSQGATEQATSLAAITGSMNEFSDKIRGNTETAAKGTQLAAQAREAAERSGNEIAHALTAMTDVQDAGIRIARIVKLIDDIAFQTNLLALNAAVEAARAGRQGKGFAVVADEVRNLAGRSAKAAKDTAAMVEDVTERIGNASAYISRLEEMLRNIVQDAIRMADSSADSSTTSAEQADGILQVNRELSQMNSVTQNTMTAAEQTATAVEVLSSQVDTLKTKLESLGDEFRIGADGGRRGRAALPAINLLDGPGNGDALPHSYLDDDYDGLDDAFSSGYDNGGTEQSAAGDGRDDWNLGVEGSDLASSLDNFLKQDGYDGNLRDFLHNTNIYPRDTRFVPGDRDEAEVGPEGDRVVRPDTKIILDDSEFGRY